MRELDPSLLGLHDSTVNAVHAVPAYIQWPSQVVISQSFHINLPLPDSLCLRSGLTLACMSRSEVQAKEQP